MPDNSLDAIQKKTGIADFGNISPKETGCLMRHVDNGTISADDLIKIMDHSANFVQSFSTYSKALRTHLIQKGKTQRAFIEAATDGIRVQCSTLDSIASQMESPDHKLKVAEIVQVISKDFFHTIREINKSKTNWWEIAGAVVFGILIGMGLQTPKDE